MLTKILHCAGTQVFRRLYAVSRLSRATIFSNSTDPRPRENREDVDSRSGLQSPQLDFSALHSPSTKGSVVWRRDPTNVDTKLEPDPEDHPRVPPSFILAKMRAGMGKFANEPVTILGIETSCDDTAVGVVDVTRRILGQAKTSQDKEHKQAGGVIPRVARRCHESNIEAVTSMALEQSGRSLEEVGGIAVTIGPGMTQCLEVGVAHAKELARKANKPLIPIHHMEAHALTARLDEDIPFPHLVLLCSGGHCILTIAEHVNRFSVLGTCLDDSPGAALDRCARAMCLDRHPDGAGLPGGVAIEKLAKKGNPDNITLIGKDTIMANVLDCNFSFSGLRTAAECYCESQKNLGWDETTPIPMCEDVAAAVQRVAVNHIFVRTQRALMYCRLKWPQLRHLVVSGGVASNQTLRSQLAVAAELFDFDLHVPSPELCTDNGVMIAWAAIERIKALEEGASRRESCYWLGGDGVYWTEKETKDLAVFYRIPLGDSLSEEIAKMKLRSSVNLKKMQKNIVLANGNCNVNFSV